jgi:hypothetical protein
MSSNVLSATIAQPAVVQGTVVPALTASNSNVLRFTSSTTPASQAVPRPATSPAPGTAPTQDWRGRDVEIKNEDTTAANFVFFAFSKGAAVTLGTVANHAGSATGAPRVDRGEFLAANERVRRTIPRADPLQTGATREDVFFNWLSGAGTPNISITLVEHER